MSQNPDRQYDKTHLSIDLAEERGFIHRDYIAHCFRWSHVTKYLMAQAKYKRVLIMDVGCGKDFPLPRLMYANRMTGFGYIGCDINKLELPEMLATAVANGKADIQVLSETDASKVTYEDLEFVDRPDFFTMFEVAEHVHPRILKDLLTNLYNLGSEDAVYFFSTPCYNGSAAANHINEMSYDAFGFALEKCGFSITTSYGTFASQSDIKDKLDKEYPNLFTKLGLYYDSNVLSTIFAPLYPAESRNAIWVCGKRPDAPKWFVGNVGKSKIIAQNQEAFEEVFCD